MMTRLGLTAAIIRISVALVVYKHSEDTTYWPVVYDIQFSLHDNLQKDLGKLDFRRFAKYSIQRMNNLQSLWLNAGKITAVIAAFALLATGCLKKESYDPDRIKDGTWNPTLAVPLIKSTITVYDILDRLENDSIIVIDSTGLLALIYESELFSVTADQAFTIPAQNQLFPYALLAGDVTTLNGGGTVSIPASVTGNYTPSASGEQLEVVVFKAGTLTFSLTNSTSSTATYTITVPGLTLGGTAYSTTIVATAGATVNVNEPLAGYVFDLTRGGTTTNQFDVNGSFSFTDPSPGGNVLGQTSVLNMSITGANFASLVGFFGTTTFATGPDSVRIKLFENSTGGTIFYEDPKLFLHFYNSIGVPTTRIDVNAIGARCVVGGQTPITWTSLPSLNINGPSYPGGVGTFVQTDFELNKSNSNIQTITTNRPLNINYDINSVVNPGGVSATRNFVLDTSRIRLLGEIMLPFWGYAYNFTKTDTTDFDINDIFDQNDDVEEVVKILFRLNVNNGFPADGWCQVYFADSNFVIIDSLLANPLDRFIESGGIDGTGRVVSPTNTVRDIVLTRDDINLLRSNNCKKVIFKGSIETLNASSATLVKIFDGYTMDVRLGCEVEFKYKIKF